MLDMERGAPSFLLFEPGALDGADSLSLDVSLSGRDEMERQRGEI